MESVCITGQFKVECELDDGVRWVFAVRHNEDEDTDIYFLTFKDAFLHRVCRNAEIVNVKTRIDDAVYTSAKFNSSCMKRRF
jgi:hypothetical protein